MSMTFDIKKVARRNLKLLKFQQQKTKEDLHQRVKRVNYQAFVWKNPLKAKQEIPEADQLGWGRDSWNYVNVSIPFSKFLVQIFANTKANVIIKSQNHFLYMMKNLNGKTHTHIIYNIYNILYIILYCI